MKMASEVMPQNNINLVSESLVYDIFTKNSFHLHDLMNYGANQEYNISGESLTYSESNRSTPEFVKMPYNLMPSSQCKISCNNNNNNRKKKNLDQRTYLKNAENFRTNSPKVCNGDDASFTHKDNNGTKCQEKTANNQNEFYDQPGVFHPNLYQPIVHYNRQRYYHNSSRYNEENMVLMEKKAHGLMKRFQARIFKLKIDPNPPDLMIDGPWDQLNQGMWDLFINRIQKEETYINKLNLWKSIFLFLRTSLNSYGLYLVGSTMSGLGLEGSDIDLCLLTKPIIHEPRVDSFHQLNHLKYLLLKNGLASEAELIMAKVPILKFKNKETGFEIDLNCNNAVGIQNTHLLYCYAQLDWRVRPLVVIVKIWAQANHINDAKNMTISSYSWALMVIHYLQCGVTPPVLPCLHELFPDKFNSYENHSMDVHEEVEDLKELESDNTRCLGDLLIGFFQYYSYFNFSQFAISVRTGSQLPIETCKQARSPKNDPHQWKYLCIEEPFDFSNTARSVFDLEVFKHIKQIIMSSYKELARNKTLDHVLPVNLKR